MKTSNPALKDGTFQSSIGINEEKMTLSGTIQKSFFLLALLIFSAAWSWQNSFPSGWSNSARPEIPAWYFPICIGAMILGFVIIFKKNFAPYLAPLYAICEGFLLGTLSALMEVSYPGIVFQAVLCTFGTFTLMLIAYQSGWIRATEKFKMGIIVATGAIVLAYLVDLILSFFGMSMPLLNSSSPLGIGISVVIVGVAALNLILDFDLVEKGVEAGAPKYMEWYGSFALMVTLVWLYLEILRLLSKMQKK